MGPFQGSISPYADVEVKHITVSKAELSFHLKANCPSVFQTDKEAISASKSCLQLKT